MSEHMIRDADDALRAIQLLEQSDVWGYGDRDLLCRVLRYLLTAKVNNERSTGT